MKFRVIKENGFYYVQRKWLFWWIAVSYIDFEFDSRIHMPFDNLPNAVQFINELIPRKNTNVVFLR